MAEPREPTPEEPSMRWNDLREEFQEQHAHLRGKASVLRSLASQVLRGDDELASALAQKGRDLQLQLLQHIRWEEQELMPVLVRFHGGAILGIREIMNSEHVQQRQRVAESLRNLAGDSLPLADLARHLLELIGWLESDMDAEERRILGALPPSRRAPS